MHNLTQADLPVVVDLMRNLSLQTDPQAASRLYGEGLDKLNLVPSDRYLSLSRRDLSAPWYRITRSDTWTTHPNPWKERDKLPLFDHGLLGEVLYSNEPAIIDNLQNRIAPDDPAIEYFRDMNLLIGLPHFDNGQSLNAGIILMKDPAAFSFDSIPMLVWQANLWGRATINLVHQQKLQQALNAIDRELEVVADIQRSLLPRVLPEIPGVRVAAHYQTSQHAGGDYYDFFPLPDDQWGIFLADVSGHGTPAAVLMAITHAIAHTHPGELLPPPQVLAFINEKLARHYTTDNGNFVTAFYGVYNPRHRHLTYASAGHPPPRLIRKRTILDIDGENSLPLGISANEKFFNHCLELEPGDQVLLYTDGITDTFNPAGDAFGLERLDAACCGGAESPRDLINKICERLADFSQGAPVTDDRTLVALAL